MFFKKSEFAKPHQQKFKRGDSMLKYKWQLKPKLHWTRPISIWIFHMGNMQFE